MENEYRWLSPPSKIFLERDYLLKGQSLDQRANVIADTAEKILNKSGFKEKFIENLKKGWYSLSTPIWTNFGTDRGLPISCFNSHLDDKMSSIMYTFAEVGMMSKVGGGTSAYFGDLRHRGAPITNNGESSGAVNILRMFDIQSVVVSQGKTRRGNFAAYLPIDHKDIKEFLSIRAEGNAIQDLSFGVCVPDYWLQEMHDGDMEKREIWAKVLEVRFNTGYPYIFFTDNVNNGTVDVYKDKKMPINASNLCSEICLPSSSDESFICCLASMNLLYYDEWKDTDAVELLTYLLDSVISEFIEKAKKIAFMERAVKFAEGHRAIGIGVIGWHSLLQSKMLPFESFEAKMLNTAIFKNIQQKTYAASVEMATVYGEPEVLKGYGRRNTTTMAIAPTTSSAFILGQVSQSIEPFKTNYYIKDLAKIKYTIKNPFLVTLLEEKGKNTDDIWQSILMNGGSVQHLSFLTEHEKNVFKTFVEISPMEIIIQAAQRQKFIDQAQSLNLMIHPNTPAKEVNALYLEAWRMGVKTLYYQHNVNAAQQFSRSILTCTSCEA